MKDSRKNLTSITWCLFKWLKWTCIHYLSKHSSYYYICCIVGEKSTYVKNKGGHLSKTLKSRLFNFFASLPRKLECIVHCCHTWVFSSHEYAINNFCACKEIIDIQMLCIVLNWSPPLKFTADINFWNWKPY